MPTATDELRETMKGYFGDPIDDHGPTEFLKSKGWYEMAPGLWKSPADPTEKEWDCVNFLCDEWDHAYVGVQRR